MVVTGGFCGFSVSFYPGSNILCLTDKIKITVLSSVRGAPMQKKVIQDAQLSLKIQGREAIIHAAPNLPLHGSVCEPGGRFHSPGPQRTVWRSDLSLPAPQPTAPAAQRQRLNTTVCSWELSIILAKPNLHLQCDACCCCRHPFTCLWLSIDLLGQRHFSHSNWLTQLWSTWQHVTDKNEFHLHIHVWTCLFTWQWTYIFKVQKRHVRYEDTWGTSIFKTQFKYHWSVSYWFWF